MMYANTRYMKSSKVAFFLTPKGPREPKWLFVFLGKLFETVDMDGSFPMRRFI
jgi:hypothetical protein